MRKGPDLLAELHEKQKQGTVEIHTRKIGQERFEVLGDYPELDISKGDILKLVEEDDEEEGPVMSLQKV